MTNPKGLKLCAVRVQEKRGNREAMARAPSMARPIKALASLLLSHPTLPRPPTSPLPKPAPFSSSAAAELGGMAASKLSRESVIYGLKALDKAPAKALDLFRWVEGRSPAQLGETAYALMLRILARKDWAKEFWAMLSEMSERGLEMDRETYETLAGRLAEEKMAGEATALGEFYRRRTEERESDAGFNAAVEAIRGSEWGGGVEKGLEEVALSVSDKMCLRFLRALQWEPDKAMGFFRWADGRESGGYRHSSTTYNAMVRILGKNGLVGQFWDLVKEMKSEGFDIDIDTYIKLFRHFRKKRMMNEAVELYEMMMGGPYKPSAHDCGDLLRQFSMCDDADFELVSRVIRTYEASGYCSTKPFYDGIHRAFTGMGRFDEAEKIVQTMREAGFEPDNITYSQLVFGLCKFGKLQEACRVLDDMEKLGCPPDLKTWTILIQGHCLLGEVDQALACYGKMIDKKCEADADLLQVLVKGLLGKNKVDGAYTMVTELAGVAKIRPWQATYKFLIERLLGVRKLEEALNVLRLMKKHNYPPYADAFVNYISKFGTVHDAVEYFKVLSVKQYPSSTSYLRVFEAFFKEGRHSEVQDLLYKCPYHIRNHGEILKVFSGTKAKKAAADKEEKTLEIAA